VSTTAELAQALRSVDGDQARYAAKYAEFLERYCGREDGRASERALARLLGTAEEQS
jgi:hypothetical protein